MQTPNFRVSQADAHVVDDRHFSKIEQSTKCGWWWWRNSIENQIRKTAVAMCVLLYILFIQFGRVHINESHAMKNTITRTNATIPNIARWGEGWLVANTLIAVQSQARQSAFEHVRPTPFLESRCGHDECVNMVASRV